MKKIGFGLALGLLCVFGCICAGVTDVLAAAEACYSSGTNYDASKGQVCCAPGTVRGGDKGAVITGSLASCNVKEDAANKDLMSVLNKVINVIVGAVGIVAVAMMVIGGISIATSQGDTSKVTKGKNTLIFGIVGLIVAILAFAIVNFVLSGVFG